MIPNGFKSNLNTPKLPLYLENITRFKLDMSLIMCVCVRVSIPISKWQNVRFYAQVNSAPFTWQLSRFREPSIFIAIRLPSHWRIWMFGTLTYIGDLIRMASLSTILTIKFHLDLKILPMLLYALSEFWHGVSAWVSRTYAYEHGPNMWLRINLYMCNVYVNRVRFNMKINLVTKNDICMLCVTRTTLSLSC